MALKSLKLAILISGRGSNMRALLEACAREDFPARAAVVISNRPGVPGLEKARQAGIAVETIDHKSFASREDFEKTLADAVRRYDANLICLAGFMRVLTPFFLSRFENKVINIHPSLLPDYKGLDTHARVLADGRLESGCTVHYVVPEMDSGPVILQKRVPVLPGDTPETLAARVLAQEHLAYPEAIRLLAGSAGAPAGET